MRDGGGTGKMSKLSWSKSLVRKWFNIRGKSHDFHADAAAVGTGSGRSGGGDDDWRDGSFTRRDSYAAKKSRTERASRRSHERSRRSKIDLDAAEATVMLDYRIFAATWNVGGRAPPGSLSLDDWLRTSPPADIYVLGFQEIVPLNAGNVLGAEDNGPARKWVSLVRRTLNSLPGSGGSGSLQTPSPAPYLVAEMDADFERSTRNDPSFFHRRSFQSGLSRSMRVDGDILAGPGPARLERRYSVNDRVMYGSRPSDYEANCRWGGGGGGQSDDEDDHVGGGESPITVFSPMSHGYGNAQPMEECSGSARGPARYCLVASKQMVGLFLMIWARKEMKNDIRNLKVSCVGRGLMGYLGNKGSISISMVLHQTSFCFVCSHLTSGQKDGDEHRRNSDVMEILRKTRFPRVCGQYERSPETILEHESVKALVEMRNWKALLEKDQLTREQRGGRVFAGWNEGRIYFPPTYKYSNNSDKYAGDDMNQKEKKRTPAWCDRILWYGRGLSQLSYVRGESRFSDHRPVYSMFIAEVESINHTQIQKMSSWSSQLDIEELLPYSYGYTEIDHYGYTDLNFY
ncbi:hypothetical protein BDA96_01G259500 [Sorghum bicolor]|uniref:Inositol polyphosphate-related phosphatase domain-containing protein n=1 Tax=Sorghum bicolor TaxID=4558 RepID=A0A921UYV3_SORBI|nr:hypothetical protein BDA96_01G259500 [Sorghum bicolor]